MSDEVVWVVIAGLFLVGELFTLDLTLLMFGLAALLGAGAALLGLDVVWQILAFAVASGGLTLGLRPVAKRHLTRAPELRTGVDALVGATAVVVERVDGHGGRIKLSGELWSARSFPPDTVFDAGETVRVLRIEGATAVVHQDVLPGEVPRREKN